MTALCLDAGAFIAVEPGDVTVHAYLEAAGDWACLC